MAVCLCSNSLRLWSTATHTWSRTGRVFPLALSRMHAPCVDSLQCLMLAACSCAPFIQRLHSLFCPSRDLKLDNTLLDSSTPPMLKLCDFGFAKTWEENEEANMYTHIG